ncbi:MAG: heme-binding protein [Verrucomicrobiae bacterium]|nr:heme-binding protein [Verrucomicrobiae bacterium]
MRQRCAFAILAALGWVTGALAQSLTTNDLKQIIAQAVWRATNTAPNAVIAITDREGFVLVVWDVNGGAPPPAGDVATAISKAGTAAFLSSEQHSFSTRTAGFIILQHFPPLLPLQTNFPLFTPAYTNVALARFPIPRGVRNRPTGPLVGVQNSQLPHSDINFFKQLVGTPTEAGTNGMPVLNPGSPFGMNGVPGGLPLYKAGRLVGGIGVVGGGEFFEFNRPTINEDIALAGQFGYAPDPRIWGSRVFVDGIRLPYIRGRIPRINTNTVFFSASTPGAVVPPFGFTNAPTTIAYPVVVLGGVSGEVRNAIIDDPLGKLTATDVTNILSRAAARAANTRARIRLPRHVPARVFISVVNNPGTNGAAQVLGTFRMADATIFSWELAVQKARTAVFFSDQANIPFFPLPTNIAMSTRTVGFLAQALYPPGIRGTEPGPFHLLQEFISSTTSTNPPNPRLPNGITIFPGGFPLYNNAGELIGAIGVSGDGVDEDDIIATSGAVGFLPPPALRADQFIYRGARLPYAKFPRNPDLR